MLLVNFFEIYDLKKRGGRSYRDLVGLSNACERKRKMNYKESVIMIYTSGFQTPAFGIGLS